MKAWICIVLSVVAFASAAYVGIWLMFIGGIQQVVGAAHNGWPAADVAFGIARIVLAAPVGWSIAALGVLSIKVGSE